MKVIIKAVAAKAPTAAVDEVAGLTKESIAHTVKLLKKLGYKAGRTVKYKDGRLLDEFERKFTHSDGTEIILDTYGRSAKELLVIRDLFDATAGRTLVRELRADPAIFVNRGGEIQFRSKAQSAKYANFLTTRYKNILNDYFN